MAAVPRWQLEGDWFDVCKCDIPCPCEFAQAPTNGACDGILAWHVRKGSYGGVTLDGLNVIAVVRTDGDGLLGGNLSAGVGGDRSLFNEF